MGRSLPQLLSSGKSFADEGSLPAGLNNSYLINSRSDLARQYNDVSVLENRHASTMYSLLAQHAEADVFRDLDWQTWKDTRKIVVNSILHTDMTYHFPMVSKVCPVLVTSAPVPAHGNGEGLDQLSFMP